ncbi:uncharacterized protein K452DRAFT_261457 [Aplosporella prunicola CBS 121167]|uniref:RNA helicase n=1 Tax=Aplosporella prunicola CBS 121167 TaxID=1176127 RepID=A0A6A6BST8_9PEZI|nr:uncharacterized protein K452DRAFT_261457 [Aplosporella prunicola CBS 121167]KAF2147182.1 hypothetical protein K452DRAFT_261457 [Aplosporella prunicola CBS 121167]
MAKRSLKESAIGDDAPEVNIKIQRKKSRKDKSAEESVTETPATDSETVDAKAEKKSKKEKKRKNKSEEVTEEESSSAADAEAAKAAKKARKEPKRAAKVTQSTDEDSEKAKRKAEKKAKKAAKQDQEDSAVATPVVESNGDAPPVTNGTTAAPADVTSGYVEDPKLTALPQSEVDAFLTKNMITLTDPLNTTAKYRPIISFEHLSITDDALRAPFKTFTAPTPIQAAAWPSLFAGRDVVGVAETGSGKTLAFGVPCVRYITSLPKKERKGVKAVIVSPTRELAAQIHEQLVKLAGPYGLEVTCIYGGVPKDDQRVQLKRASIVVATPGRLNDLIDEGSADISSAGYVVLDEADRMLDKGFEDAIRKIISSTRPMGQRQTLMFTATWPQSVRELASTFMTSPVRVNIGDNPTGELRANTRISQTVEVVEPRNKEYRLLQLLKENLAGAKKNDRILVFCLYKKEATRIEGFIRSKGFSVAGIHGDLGQSQRTASLDAFKKGQVNLLVATDVAARGLDIPEVKVVLNVTFPLTAEDYVHRIGRTGRAGKDGKAITLFTEHDKPLAGALVNVLKGANQPVPQELMKFGTTVKKKGHDAYGAFFKDTEGMKQATKITFD